MIHRLFKTCKASGWDIVTAVQLSGASVDEVWEMARKYPVVAGIAKKYLELGGRKIAVEELHARIQSGDSVNITGPSGCGKTFLARWYADLMNYETLYVDSEHIKRVRQFHRTRSIASRKKLLIVDNLTGKRIDAGKIATKLLHETAVPVVFVTESPIVLSEGARLFQVNLQDDPDTREEVIRQIFVSNEWLTFKTIAAKTSTIAEAFSVCRGGDYLLPSRRPTARELAERIIADPQRKRVYDALVDQFGRIRSDASLGTILNFVAANLPYFYASEPELVSERFSAISMADIMKYVTKPKFTAAILAYGLLPSSGTRSIINPFDEFKEEPKKKEPVVPKSEKEEKELPKKPRSAGFGAWLK